MSLFKIPSYIGRHLLTFLKSSSQDTLSRALAANVQLLPTDEDLVTQCDLILSVVPPRDAISTAKRILAAVSSLEVRGGKGKKKNRPLYFADMNAISPATCKIIEGLFLEVSDSDSATLRFIDGGILGGPPSPSSNLSTNGSDGSGWKRPLLPTSGPWSFADVDREDQQQLPYSYSSADSHSITDISTNPASDSITNHSNQSSVSGSTESPQPQQQPRTESGRSDGSRLSKILNSTHISPLLGKASSLKMVFASLLKGYTAIAVQTLTTAHVLGVLSPLKSALAELSPATLERTERAVTSMGPKAYRWVREMHEISATHGLALDGGFGTYEPPTSRGLSSEEFQDQGDERSSNNSEMIFKGAGEIFKFVAEETVLGREKVPIVFSTTETNTNSNSNNEEEGESNENNTNKSKNKRVRGTTSEDVAICMARGLEERGERERKRRNIGNLNLGD